MLGQEIRKRIVAARERGITVAEIAKVNGITERTIYNLMKQYREKGSIEPRKGQHGPRPVLGEEELKRLDQAIQECPDITIHELRETLQIPLSESRISRIIREKLGYTYKKRCFMPQSRIGPMCRLSESSGWRHSQE